jgi:hypothetical protein
MIAPKEPRNPFYFLLLAASILFVATALAYGVLPQMDEPTSAGVPTRPHTAFGEALRSDGHWWLLAEVAAMAFFALLSMALDRLRSLQKAPPAGTIPSSQDPSTSLS